MLIEDKEKIIAAGYDLDGALSRFINNEMLFMSFLKKVPNDEHFKSISPYIKNKEYDEAHKAAHAIKGIVGNLGLTPVYESSSDLCVALKKANDEADINAKYEVFEKEFIAASELINSLN